MKDSAFENFSEEALEALDFARCQRPDGSFYGTSGQCRKGSPAGAKEKEAPKGRAKAAAPAKAPSAKAQAASDIKAKRAEVRSMDKVAKAAEKKAEAADKAWRKAGMPKGDQQKEVRRLDKIAKSADKEASKADRELQRMAKSAKSAKGREANVKLNNAIQDGPKATGSQRQAAMKVLRQERNRLENMEDEGRLSKAGAARLKLVKASQREYEIDGKQRMKAQTK